MISSVRCIKVTPVGITVLCIIAEALNSIIYPILVPGFGLPLFVDTVFTAAVTFYAGLIPGLATALLTWVIGFTIKDGLIHPFIICSIAEVIIIFLLKPATVNTRIMDKERKRSVFVGVLAQLMVLFIIASLAVSLLGGLIDYIFYTALPNTKPSFSAEDAFKEWLFQRPLPVPVLNILSRIPVNLIDRFIVIFGGYFISRTLAKFLKR